MRKLTALTVAISFSVNGPAFAGPPHAPAAHAPAAHALAVHPHATSQAGASHAPTGQALHAIENKKTTSGTTLGTESDAASDTAPTRDQVSAAVDTEVVTEGSYVAGLEFAVGAVMKFKQHKDNPAQIPVGEPIALVAVAAALLFLPSVLSVVGYTVVGTAETTDVPGVMVSTE
jgi:hypothetical protein